MSLDSEVQQNLITSLYLSVGKNVSKWGDIWIANLCVKENVINERLNKSMSIVSRSAKTVFSVAKVVTEYHLDHNVFGWRESTRGHEKPWRYALEKGIGELFV